MNEMGEVGQVCFRQNHETRYRSMADAHLRFHPRGRQRLKNSGRVSIGRDFAGDFACPEPALTYSGSNLYG